GPRTAVPARVAPRRFGAIVEVYGRGPPAGLKPPLPCRDGRTRGTNPPPARPEEDRGAWYPAHRQRCDDPDGRGRRTRRAVQGDRPDHAAVEGQRAPRAGGRGPCRRRRRSEERRVG